MSEVKQKNNKTGLYILSGVFVIVLVAIIFVSAKPTGHVVSSGEFDTFAKCLTESGAVFYGAEWCGHCNDQKEMFGDSVEFLNFVDCDKNKDVCVSEEIRAYPTWKVDGKAYVGLQEFTKLSDITSCDIFT